MTRTLFLAVALVLSGGAATVAQWPPRPFLPPLPAPPTADIQGYWYFRGDPGRPCTIEARNGRRGARLVLVNENGTEADGRLLWDGRTVVVPGWNTRGEYRGNAIVWQNGDFWAR